MRRIFSLPPTPLVPMLKPTKSPKRNSIWKRQSSGQKRASLSCIIGICQTVPVCVSVLYRFSEQPFLPTPWFGVPVQWNGLVYAYALQHLARHTSESQSQLWSKVAEGITISAMYQQWTEGELKGTYPDGLYGYCTEGRGPHINPEDIMVNLYTLRGLDPDIATGIVRVQDNRIHMSSGARIDELDYDDSNQLTFSLRYVQNETSYCIITGYGRQFSETESSAKRGPSAIRTRGGELRIVDNLSTTESGWLYREEKDIVFIKYKHLAGVTDFEVFPPEKVEPPQEAAETNTPSDEREGE